MSMSRPVQTALAPYRADGAPDVAMGVHVFGGYTGTDAAAPTGGGAAPPASPIPQSASASNAGNRRTPRRNGALMASLRAGDTWYRDSRPSG